MPGIDYSKWDSFNASTSESDSESNGELGNVHNASHHPSTTKLSYPSRVVIGPNGATIQDMPPAATASPFQSARDDTTSAAPAHVGSSSPTSAPMTTTTPTASFSSALRGSATVSDDAGEASDILVARLTRNGGREGASHMWAQTPDTATVSFFVPSATKARHISAFRIAADTTGPCREPSQGGAHVKTRIEFVIDPDAITGSAEPITVSKLLRYPVKLDEELLEGCWQLESLPGGERVLVVELFKESLGIAGMTLWWDRCFTDDVTSVVDTRAITDRKDSHNAAASSQPAERSAFQKTWDEAHDLFRARMQERRRAQE